LIEDSATPVPHHNTVHPWPVVRPQRLAARRDETPPGCVFGHHGRRCRILRGMSTGRSPPVELPDGLLDLLRRRSPCFLATVMPDGGPQLTQTWVDTDGHHILINSVQGHQKINNIRRDPRVALNVSDSDRPSRYYAVRGRVLDITTSGAAEHIEKLAQRYLGKPYPWYGGQDQVRLLLTIKADRISTMG
jgi:PPOX class probable F420-dependent enzyme